MALVGGIYLAADMQFILQSFVDLIFTATLRDHYHCYLQITEGIRAFKIKNLMQQIWT